MIEVTRSAHASNRFLKMQVKSFPRQFIRVIGRYSCDMIFHRVCFSHVTFKELSYFFKSGARL